MLTEWLSKLTAESVPARRSIGFAQQIALCHTQWPEVLPTLPTGKFHDA
jgi:hypothetical protein